LASAEEAVAISTSIPYGGDGRRLRSQAMGNPRCRQPNRFKRLIAFLSRRCEQTVPSSWLDEPPANPDIGVREPRRPRPNGSAGTVLLEPPL
jgi:hypothetical protein